MRKEHFALLKEFSAYRPASADPAAVDKVQLRMKRFLEDNGIFCTLEAVEDRHLLFASTTGNKTPDILFNPHVDVVPATDPEVQYEVFERDGKIWGRGVADDLGNAVCVAQTLIELKGSGVDAGAKSLKAFFTIAALIPVIPPNDMCSPEISCVHVNNPSEFLVRSSVNHNLVTFSGYRSKSNPPLPV